MPYAPIEGLPSAEEIEKLQSTNLEALSKLWLAKKGAIERLEEYQHFEERMQREWAIETGIIERLYTWDRGITEMLIEQGVDASIIIHNTSLRADKAEKAVRLIEDQRNILEGLFSFVKGEKAFSEHYIRAMHAEFTKNQDHTEAVDQHGNLVKICLLKGKYKKHPNNPRRPDGEVHEYCPPGSVVDEMERLVKIYLEGEETIPPEVLAAWVHHRFTQIHPFQDGNGRMARAIASLIFLKKGLLPLVIRDSDREEYIRALEEADGGNIQSLVRLFSRCQRDSILSALDIKQELEPAKHSAKIISDTIEFLNARAKAKQEPRLSVYEVAEILQEIAEKKLCELQSTLDKALRGLERYEESQFSVNFKAAKNSDEEASYYKGEISKLAREYAYNADLSPYISWARLVISTDTAFEIVFNIHGNGDDVKEGMIATVFTFEKPRANEEDRSKWRNIRLPTPGSAVSRTFSFNNTQEGEKTITRFSAWWEGTVTTTLLEWRRSLE